MKKLQTLGALGLSALIALSPSLALAQAALIPNAQQQYFDDDGNPLVGGSVFYYVPNTTTKKTTWSDVEEVNGNTNPVILDAAGRAVIFGQGDYRQILKDSLGNIIWDGFTSAYGSSIPSGGSAQDTAPIGSVMAFGGFSIPENWVLAFGQALTRADFPELFDAITIFDDAVSCTNSSPSVTGFASTAQMRIGAPIEASCLPTGTTISSISSPTAIVASLNATLTGASTARVFPWGNGDGTLTFNVPDLRGVAPVGACAMGGSACSVLTESFYGASPNAPGVAGGNEEHELTIAEIAAHAHAQQGMITSANQSANHTHTQQGTFTSGTESATHTHAGGTLAVGTTITNGASVVHSPVNTEGVQIGGGEEVASSSQTTSVSTLSLASGTVISGASATESATHTHQTTLSGQTATQSASHTHQVVLTGNTSSVGSGDEFSVVQPSLTINYIIKVTPSASGLGGVVSIGGMFGDILCGTGLTCEDQTISANGLADIADLTFLSNISGSTAPASANTLTQVLDAMCGSDQGSILTRESSDWACLEPGTSGQLLQANGSADLSWVTPGGGIGTVTSVGLSAPTGVFDVANSPITSSGTIALSFDTQADNTVLAGPASGGPSTPTFRQLAASELSNGVTGSGAVALATSPTFVTPTLGAALATSINGLTISSTASTLTIASGKVASISNTLTLTGTDSTSFAFPATSSTVLTTANAQSISAAKTFADDTLVLGGSTSGTLTLNAPDAAGTNVVTFPAGTTDFSATGGTGQVLRQSSTGSALTVATLSCADLSDDAASCATDATNASNIGSGTLNTARLPSPFTNGTRSGNTSQFGTTSGTLTAGDCLQFDASGNIVSAGGACTTGGGGGTVTAGVAGEMTYYASSGTTVVGNPEVTWAAGVLTLGVETSDQGSLALAGATDGTITLTTSGDSDDWTFTLPDNDGDMGECLTTNGSGVTSWGTCGSGGAQTPWTSDIDADGFDLQFDDATGIASTEGTNPAILYFTSAATAVNYWSLSNSATGGVNRFEALGSDSDIAITLASKGTDPINFEINAATELSLSATALSAGTNDGLALGTSSVGFSDAFFADGGVVTFGTSASRATITHVAASDSIVISADPDGSTAGSEVSLVIDGTTEAVLSGTSWSPGANAGASLGESGLAWAALWLSNGAPIEFNGGTDSSFTCASGNCTIEGNGIYRAGGTDVALADGGTGNSLSDPGADRILFWDESGNIVDWLTPNTGLSISTTNLNCNTASTTVVGCSEFAIASEYRTGTDTSRSLVVDQVWAAAALATLTSASNSTAVDFSTGFNFTETLSENTTLANPSNEKVGQTGCMFVTASGGTRTVTLHADYTPASGVESFPISIASGATVCIAYFIQAASTVRINAVLRY